ncbi:HypC/HybG/HupF family hydrogenase formation chaperone [Streptomyces sp. NPDC057694]|uniref:HypC/HybG/HupF family hydrogenase formation chaperone n=1 Tax=Streptomyces sp. NPDC057694 TaxID=3346216 RepID=UPI00368186A8
MCLGIPGRITEIHDSEGLRMATVDFGGVRREVCLEYTPVAAVGTYVVVHVGFAITTVDEAEARRTLDVLRAMADTVEGELGEPLPREPGRGHPGPPGPALVPGQPLTADGRPPEAG